jgi:hypothetical protein
MAQIPYVFSQLAARLPKDSFDRLVKKYSGNAYVKSFTCWNQLLVMLWAQITNRRSLRDIEISLNAHSDKLYRMGIGRQVKRNTLANANSLRDVAIFRELAQEMMRRASKIAVRDKLLKELCKEFALSGFFAIDSSTVSLDLTKYRWTVPQKGLGGVKIHTMFDLLRKVPSMCMITGHEECDQVFMDDYNYQKECFYSLDKAYVKANSMYKIHKAGAYFVVRIKRNMVYDIIDSSEETDNIILADQIIKFTSRWAHNGYPDNLRLITYYSEDKNITLKFLTNNTELPAISIALAYKYRWDIELFFRWIKQHLRITSFYGTSHNAVAIQIYTAFITYCLIAIVADEIKFDGSLYEFANILSVSSMEKILIKDLIKRLDNIDDEPSDYRFPSLFDEWQIATTW